jgi:hypothetical protein
MLAALFKGDKPKDRKAPEDFDMSHMLNRMSDIEQRQSESDIRVGVAMGLFEEVREQSTEIKKQLTDMDINIMKALTQLEERRGKR